eukprot:SAG31_NODE_100_length_25264_cov_38.715359_6_plen_59_part_00
MFLIAIIFYERHAEGKYLPWTPDKFGTYHEYDMYVNYMDHWSCAIDGARKASEQTSVH